MSHFSQKTGHHSGILVAYVPEGGLGGSFQPQMGHHREILVAYVPEGGLESCFQPQMGHHREILIAYVPGREFGAVFNTNGTSQRFFPHISHLSDFQLTALQ